MMGHVTVMGYSPPLQAGSLGSPFTHVPEETSFLVVDTALRSTSSLPLRTPSQTNGFLCKVFTEKLSFKLCTCLIFNINYHLDYWQLWVNQFCFFLDNQVFQSHCSSFQWVQAPWSTPILGFIGVQIPGKWISKTGNSSCATCFLDLSNPRSSLVGS